MNEYTFDYVERNRLDAFCKTVLRNEAITYLSELARRRDREKPLDTLPQAEMDKLCTLDEYPSDSFTFSAFGYDLHIRDELVAGAFASLPEQEQQILILRCRCGYGGRRDRRPCGDVPQRRPAPQDKHSETVAREIDGVNAGREEREMKQPTFHGRVLLPLSVFANGPRW